MFRVLDKFNRKQYGVDCISREEAECVQNEHPNSIIVNLDVDKETRKDAVQRWWKMMQKTQEDRKIGLVTRETEDKVREIWLSLDTEYIAMYNEDY